MIDFSPHQESLLRRYQRLFGRYQIFHVTQSLTEIANTMACSPRYARVLLARMQDAGWLSWESRPGRGAKGHLQCRVDEAALKAIYDGEFEPSLLSVMNKPIQTKSNQIGDGGEYRLQFHRPLMPPVPSLYLARAEQHLVQMVHSGLTRWLPGMATPTPALAHTIKVTKDGLFWHFFLRTGLVWHSGESVKPAQLIVRLRQLIGGPALPYVTDIKLHGHKITFQLSQPDERLLHRLANPAYALAHPEHGTCGLGPFKIEEHTNLRLVLVRFNSWYGESPHASKISFESTLREAPDWNHVRLESTIPTESRITLHSSDAFSFLTFNLKKNALDTFQQAMIRQLLQRLVLNLRSFSNNILPLTELFEGPEENPISTALPPSLTLAYFSTWETDELVQRLKKSLSYWGCKLQLKPLSAINWLLPKEEWEEQDICLGLWRSDMNNYFIFEEQFRHSVMLPSFLPDIRRSKSFLEKLSSANARRYNLWIKRIVRYCISKQLLTPLWLQRYQLDIPSHVNGVKCYSQCWPDFSKIWIDDGEVVKILI